MARQARLSPSPGRSTGRRAISSPIILAQMGYTSTASARPMAALAASSPHAHYPKGSRHGELLWSPAAPSTWNTKDTKRNERRERPSPIAPPQLQGPLSEAGRVLGRNSLSRVSRFFRVFRVPERLRGAQAAVFARVAIA